MREFLICITILLIVSQSLVSQRGPKGNRGKKGGSAVLITGVVLDSDSQLPMEYATVSIYSKKDSSIVTGSLTDLAGIFELVVRPGNYYIKTEFISYSSTIYNDLDFKNSGSKIDIGNILLSPESELLDNIEIVGERSETTFALDKKIFTVGKDLANRGGSAEDILDNVPSVTVDIDGAVSLRGSDGVRILIDGRPSGMAGVGNTNGLRNIPANLIERVEVITNPSSRYEAEGMAGIINIVLKKNDNSGFNGSFDLTGGYPRRLGASANINYRKNKLNWFLNYGLNDNLNPGGGYRIQDQLLTNSAGDGLRQLSLQDRDQRRESLSNSFRFGADYFLTDKEQITAAFLYRKSDENNLTTIIYEDYIGESSSFLSEPLWERDIDKLSQLNLDNVDFSTDPLTSIIRRIDDEKEDEKNLEYSLNYRKEFSSREHTLNAVVQFREKSEIESSQFGSENTFNIEQIQSINDQRSNNDEADKTWLVQLDYIHPLGKDHKYELGLRSSIREITNDFLVEEEMDMNYMAIEGLSNNFIYDENVHAAYGIYGNTISKFSYQVGLRGEHSQINTRLLQTSEGGENERSYTNLFPSGFLNYGFSETSAIQASYSRRIRRPRFWDLNPFFTFSDNRNFYSGNPNLNPEFTDSYEIGQIQYWDNLSLNSSLFYRTTDASIQRILVIDNMTSNTLRLPVNIGRASDMGLDMSLSYSGIKWLRLDGNWNIFRNIITILQDDVTSTIYDNFKVVRNYTEDINTFQNEYNVSINQADNITWNGRLTARITVFDSDIQMRANYRGPRQSTQGSRRAVGSLDVGWSKDLLSKRMTLTLSVRDLLNTRKRNGVTLLDGFADRSEFQWRSRTASLTASYRINQKKKRKRQGGNYENEEF